MEDNNTDELFEITARNYQKLSENLEKVNFKISVIFLFICVGEEKIISNFKRPLFF